MNRRTNFALLADCNHHRILKVTMSICMALLISMVTSADVITFDDNWGQAGFNLVAQDNAGVEVVFSVTQMAIIDQEINGQTMQFIQIPGIYLPNDAGAPNLPGDGRYIAIPRGASATVQILATRTEVYANLDIAPAPPIPLETDDSPPVFEKNPAIYNQNAYYPESAVRMSDPAQIRGVDIVILGITPFQYNPVTRDLLVYKDIRVRVNFIGGSGQFGEDRLRNRYWEPLLKQHLLNYQALPEVNFDRLPVSDEDNCEYVIIVPDDPTFIAWADTIKAWRTQQGIITGITTLSEIGGNNWSLIFNYIVNAYYTWQIPPVAILLLSDYQYSGDLYGITSPIWNNYCVSDNMYADMNADNLPDLAIARITAQNEGQLSTMIEKSLDYERFPPEDPGFYDHPLIAGGWQDDRWFILCCEVIWGYFTYVHGKNPGRQYAGYTGGAPTFWSTNSNTWMIVNYFGPSGLGYIPATPEYLTNWTGNASGINTAINSGAFLVQHRDHGAETGWGTPSYYNWNLVGLYNTMLPFVFSTNCLTGKFNWENECFAEAFHRMQYGALGLIAASEVSYSFVNDAYQWGVYDSMWPDFDPGYGTDSTGSPALRPCFGNASGKYYLQASSWPNNPNNKVVTYHLFHHHGDAFITLYSELPQNLSVTHAPILFAGETEFSVTADSGAIIALTVDNQIIGIGEGTGAPLAIPIEPQLPGNTMLVTATLQNHFRYMEEVDIITQASNYVVFYALQINDAAGNNNGLFDLGESALLSIAVENLGTQTASNIEVTISTEDAYTTVLDSTEIYPSIPSGSRAVAFDAFEISASSVIPDLHEIPFTLSATNGDSIWTSWFIITAHAPEVFYDSLVIEDPTGNYDHHLDPGETADFHVTLKNEGSGDAADLAIALSCDESLISISQDTAYLSSLAAGEQATIIYNTISADPSVGQGDTVYFNLAITGWGGYATEDGFSTIIGDLRRNPSGPDGYGYYAYDLYDGPEAPQYEWQEIAPAAGGSGTDLELGNNEIVTIPLPFTFQFYGMDYGDITVCSNGWLTIGATTIFYPLNLPIPHTVPPNNLVAGFWDELVPEAGGQICYDYDEEAYLFIVEWYQLPHVGYLDSLETFQIVLYDPDQHPTSTGDGQIIVNYHTLSSLTDGCSLGIEDSAGAIGLQYLCDGEYDPLAMPLENAFAIKYTTGLVPAAEPTAGATLPTEFSLDQNYPNPFNPATHLTFSLPKSANVSLMIYDIQGREVARLVDGWRPAGVHDITFDASDLASGIYLARIQAGDFTSTQKMVLVK